MEDCIDLEDHTERHRGRAGDRPDMLACLTQYLTEKVGAAVEDAA